jgi:hypothetical protein
LLNLARLVANTTLLQMVSSSSPLDHLNLLLLLKFLLHLLIILPPMLPTLLRTPPLLSISQTLPLPILPIHPFAQILTLQNLVQRPSLPLLLPFLPLKMSSTGDPKDGKGINAAIKQYKKINTLYRTIRNKRSYNYIQHCME